MESFYKLPLVLDPQPEGGYTITCPILPNLITEADTLDEVARNVGDAIAALIEAYEDLGRPLPSILQPIATESAIWAKSLGNKGFENRHAAANCSTIGFGLGSI